MLPIADREWLLDHTINQLASIGCDQFIVITNKQKIGTIREHLFRHCADKKISFVFGGESMWNSILKGLVHARGNDIIMAMPDTLVTLEDNRDAVPKDAIQFGMFRTNQPQRFSVLVNGEFQKGTHIAPGDYQAWGQISWKASITEEMLDHTFPDFDTAFNFVRNNYSHSYYNIKKYVDFASFTDYAKYIKENVP